MCINIWLDTVWIMIFICLLTIGVDVKYNGRKDWIVSQNIKCFLFTQLVVCVDPQTCKLDMIHSSMPPSCAGYGQCCVVTTQCIVIGPWVNLNPIMVPCEGS